MWFDLIMQRYTDIGPHLEDVLFSFEIAYICAFYGFWRAAWKLCEKYLWQILPYYISCQLAINWI
jgi:hypothetical protein